MRSLIAMFVFLFVPALAMAQVATGTSADPGPLLEQAVSAWQAGAYQLAAGLTIAVVIALLGRLSVLQKLSGAGLKAMSVALAVAGSVSAGLIAGQTSMAIIMAAVMVAGGAFGLVGPISGKK